MCEVTNVLLYFIFSMHYNMQLDSCSIEYQMLQQIVANYELVKIPVESVEIEVEIDFTCVLTGRCD